MTSHVGELLKAWRKEKKLTGVDLARQTSINRTTLTRWEAGQTQPRMAELEAVLTALEVSATQRQEALAHIQAPRAVKVLREAAGLSSPPVCGDLLRAMRLRQGWTQQETARRAGIAQGTLARWENTEDWPSPERLHILCYVLHAQEAELIALMQGLVTTPLPRQVLLDSERVRTILSHYMFSSTLTDIEFLSFESQLWNLAQKENAAQNLLIYTYGYHARFLAEHQRYTEAAGYVKRLQQLAHRGYHNDAGIASAVIAASRIAGMGGRIPNPKRAIKILRVWVDSPLVRERHEYRAWMHSEIAKHLLAIGEADLALRLSRKAIRLAENIDDGEPWYRRGDYARVLVGAGYYDKALEECRAFLDRGEPPADMLPFILIGAQALAVNRPTEAADWLRRMEEILVMHPEAAHYYSPMNELRQRL